jgi:hypothetical protein
LNRLARPILFDRTIYREVAADPYATTEAGAVVILTSLLYAIGHARLGVELALAQFPAAAVLWAVSLGVTYYLGTEVAPGLHGSGWRRVFRAVAFANVPRALVVLLLIPGAGAWLALAGVAITLVAYTQAIMETLDLDLRSAASVAFAANLASLISFAVALLILL